MVTTVKPLVNYVHFIVCTFKKIVGCYGRFSNIGKGLEGQVLYCGWEVPGCFLWVLPKRSIPKPDEHRKDNIQ